MLKPPSTCRECTRTVVTYCVLASSAVAPSAARGPFRRNIPGPIPVVVVDRLSVATSHSGHGLGRALFQDAALRAIHAGEAIGIRDLVVHTLSEDAKAFCLRIGFEESPLYPMTLMMTIPDLHAATRP